MLIARRVLLVLSWLFVLGVVVQFFLAGLGTLGGESMDAHEALGYMVLHFFPVIMLVVAFFARVPRTVLVLTLVLAVVTFVQPIWVTEFRGEFLGAMHILGAAIILALGYAVASSMTRFVRSEA